MHFNKLINSLLKEEHPSREDRIKAMDALGTSTDKFDSVYYAMNRYNMTLDELNDLIDAEGENAWDYFRSLQTSVEVDDYIKDLAY